MIQPKYLIEPGKTEFGLWKVLEEVPSENQEKKTYLCECLGCGSKAKILKWNLIYGYSTKCQSCGYKNRSEKSISEKVSIGDKYESLTIQEVIQSEDGVYPRWKLVCSCSCGKQNHLIRSDCWGRTKSCGGPSHRKQGAKGATWPELQVDKKTGKTKPLHKKPISQKILKMAEMRAKGLSYRSIADKLGKSHQYVIEAISRLPDDVKEFYCGQIYKRDHSNR